MKQESNRAILFLWTDFIEKLSFLSCRCSLETRLIAASFKLKWDINAMKNYGLE